MDKILKTIIKEWKRKKYFLLHELTEKLNYAEITVKCYLRKWGALSSYNLNSRYYTLPEIAEFDSDGLWWHNGVGFSQNGNMVQTIVHFVNLSPRGLNIGEIAELLKVDCKSLISKIYKDKKLERRNINGQYVYFSRDEERFKQQLHEHENQLEMQFGKNIPDSLAVAVLTELLKNPDLNSKDFVRHLNKQNLNITPGQLNSFLEYHGIPKKMQDSKQ